MERRLHDGIPFQWHHHREFELTLTLNSEGQRFVGDGVGLYYDHDLVLLGPNLPHTWASVDRLAADAPHVALVVWFKPEWLEAAVSGVPEFAGVSRLAEASRRGAHFLPPTGELMRGSIAELAGHPPGRRLASLLDVLARLADCPFEPLASLDVGQTVIPSADRPRIERLLDHLHANYQRRLHVEELAELVHLSPSALHRMFKRHARLTISDYVCQLRIGRACQLLIESDLPVAHIAQEAGYANLSHFNRQFLRARASSPRVFRNRFRRSVMVTDREWDARVPSPVESRHR